MTGIAVLLLAVVAALALGLRRRHVDGRFRSPSPDHDTAWQQIVAADPGARPGERATLVQFSSAFCAPCRTARVVLGEVAAREEGVRHVELDAEHHLELVRRLDVRRTPTTLLLDRDGHEVLRAAGAPRKEQVLAALAAIGSTEVGR